MVPKLRASVVLEPYLKSIKGMTMTAGRSTAAGKAIAMRDDPKASAIMPHVREICLRQQP